LIKIWRVYCKTDALSDGGESSGYVNSRLIPNSLQEHFSGTSTIYPSQLMNCECVLSFLAHGSSVTTVKYNSTGTLLISGSLDRMVKIFDLQGNCLKTLDEHSRYVNNVAINIDSTIVASGSNDKEVHIWDLTGSYTLDSHISNGLKSLLLNLHINEKEIPSEWICPITSEIMTDPVLCEDGFSYERAAISAWFLRDKRTSPMTNIVSKLIIYCKTK
jgi:WD40 repeat protein